MPRASLRVGRVFAGADFDPCLTGRLNKSKDQDEQQVGDFLNGILTLAGVKLAEIGRLDGFHLLDPHSGFFATCYVLVVGVDALKEG